jgi:hypothetical protein
MINKFSRLVLLASLLVVVAAFILTGFATVAGA